MAFLRRNGRALAAAFVIAALWNRPALAQTRPAFDVASIRATASGPETGVAWDYPPNGGFRGRNYTVWSMIRAAYGLTDLQLSGGPAWITTEGFDIQAQPSPSGAAITREQTRQMMQTLLEDRFQLKLHRETRELPAFALQVAKGGPKLPPVSSGPQKTILGDLEMPSMSLKQLGSMLEFELGRLIVDKTGLQGNFAIKLRWAPERAQTAGASDPTLPSLFTALQEQLGLKLESLKVPTEVFVIDSVERPSEN
jgi:uncharacterized protein (TIGR03435 family)